MHPEDASGIVARTVWQLHQGSVESIGWTYPVHPEDASGIVARTVWQLHQGSIETIGWT